MGGAILTRFIHNVRPEAAARGRVQEGAPKREALGIIEYWMPVSDYKKPNNNFNINKGKNISEKKIRDDHFSKK